MIDVVRNDFYLYTNTIINENPIANTLPPSVQHVNKQQKYKPSIFLRIGSEGDEKALVNEALLDPAS